MDTMVQIAQQINNKIRGVLPADFSPGLAGQIFNIVSVELTADCVERDYSKDRQCPLCRQKVVLDDYFVQIGQSDNPCDVCMHRNMGSDRYPCRWCIQRSIK